MIIRAAIALAGLLVVFDAAAQTCMVSPTAAEIVSGRYGKQRDGGAGNHGSANTRPHMHRGLDFSTNNASQPLKATTDGVITRIGTSSSAGNLILIKRANNDIVAYFHLQSFAPGLREGSQVRAGDVLGLSGNTPVGPRMAKHLHFEYGTSRPEDARVRQFSSRAQLGPFNPAQLRSNLSAKPGFGWNTDPAPYFCQTFPIRDGHPEHVAILGADTKAQHAILFGGTPPPGGTSSNDAEPAQVASANADARIAGNAGTTPEKFLQDGEGFGTPPSPPFGLYETMSANEMLSSEATRRFSGDSWNQDLTQLSERALWVDFVRSIGVSNALAHAIYKRRERVEALLATYTAQRLEAYRRRAQVSNELARRQAIGNVIQ
ncbi:M23 family metallopeptidase [Tahibacter amnicola]|uniref:M23 family metallopeptidase n=1 Tax=Tahibacter amnicola TaxID=2976241 RepID=A0ABY6BFJ2_9GAMM|nr:M23 family metallopeptidase [Tahibacter amnicola]UXI68371.1 M23 family metallopeptidase [Tahibacter amnicola]